MFNLRWLTWCDQLDLIRLVLWNDDELCQKAHVWIHLTICKRFERLTDRDKSQWHKFTHFCHRMLHWIRSKKTCIFVYVTSKYAMYVQRYLKTHKQICVSRELEIIQWVLEFSLIAWHSPVFRHCNAIPILIIEFYDYFCCNVTKTLMSIVFIQYMASNQWIYSKKNMTE